MLDIAQLRDLPLTVLIILGAYWVIQRHNDEYAKRLVALIAEFSSKYDALIKRADEDREESRQRWLERDRQLMGIVGEIKEALANNTNQTHALRSALQPLISWWELERRKADRSRDATG